MNNKNNPLVKYPALKIALLYAIVSGLYIFLSDYILELLIKDPVLISKIQTYKGLGFIVVTAMLLFILVKKNIDTVTTHYRKIIEVQQTSDNQLKGSEEKYMSLFNHSPLPMWIFDTETYRFLLVNNAACTIYGYSKEDYSNMSLRDIRPQEDIPHLESVLPESFKSEFYSFPDVIRHKKKNGEIIKVKIQNTNITYEGKTVRLASAIDITKEVDMRIQLMESNARLHQASELASLGYWTNDFIKNEIIWSEELYKIFEVDPKTFVLTLENIQSYFHPEDRVQFNDENNSDTDTDKVNESEHRIITPTGKIKWILERIYMVKNEQGIPIGLEGIAVDITKRKLYQQEIWESNERFKLLASATVEAIIDWDIENDVTIWGEGFSTLFGYDLSVYNNTLWSENIHPDDKGRVLSDLQKALADPTCNYFNADFSFLKANREVTYVQHRGLFIRNAEGKAIRALAAMIDLTESLERISKIESQNNMLKDIAWTQSHIVRAPLANLLGLVYLLKEKNQTEMSHSEIIDHIQTSAEQLDQVIHDIVKKTEAAETLQ